MSFRTAYNGEMKNDTLPSGPATPIWERIQIEGKLPPAAARALLGMHFSQQDHDRMHELSAKARAGKLTPEEESEIDTYERLGCLLDILHSKGRRALEMRKPASSRACADQ
jgi:hypothetical protein